MKYQLLLPFIILLALTVNGQKKGKNSIKNFPINLERLNYIDSAVTNAIAEKKCLGAVILIGVGDKVVYRKAFGNSVVTPEIKKMSPETVFDMASVTKPVATATAVMILVERGKLKLNDQVRKYIPGFSSYKDSSGKELHARIYHLLTHTSGLPAYADTEVIRAKYGDPAPAGTIEHIAGLKKNSPPGTEFVYSCLGFITLAEIVKIVSGKNIAEFCRDEIFIPLNMKSTTFNPAGALKERCAPTETVSTGTICGFVHDPLASIQGGISGNAGLFSTAVDMSIFCRMMLNKGRLNDKRILSPATVELMTKVYAPVKFSGRGLGWDVSSDYMGQKGELFPYEAYGHTGFTGTSLLIVPEKKLYIIILTNRLHPSGIKGDVVPLRAQIANIVAGSLDY